MEDEMPTMETTETFVMARSSFAYDSPRYRHLGTNLTLVIFFYIQRWHWNERGIYSFLSSKERELVATTCYRGSSGTFRASNRRMTMNSHQIMQMAKPLWFRPNPAVDEKRQLTKM